MINRLDSFIKDINQDKKLFGDSENWANWQSELSIFTCEHCAKNHGRIVDISILGEKNEVMAHSNCRCIYVPMRTKEAGTATDKGLDGVDFYLMYWGELPEYYIDKKAAKRNKWRPYKGNLADVLPGKMIGGDEYINDDGKLPMVNGRKWYEADFDYYGGFRNDCRILYSNDGLVFVTYDHFHTFYEIIQ